MEWWNKMIFPLRSFCSGFASRLGFRKHGLLKLRGDVRACEYEDVHVMWEMIRRNETEVAEKIPDRKKRSIWNLFGWARSAPCIACRF